MKIILFFLLMPTLLLADSFYKIGELRFQPGNKIVNVSDRDIVATWNTKAKKYAISYQAYSEIMNMPEYIGDSNNILKIEARGTAKSDYYFYEVDSLTPDESEVLKNTNRGYKLHCYYPEKNKISSALGILADYQNTIYMLDFAHTFSKNDKNQSSSAYNDIQKPFSVGGSAYILDTEREEELLQMCNHYDGPFEIRVKGTLNSYLDSNGYPAVIKNPDVLHAFKMLQGRNEIQRIDYTESKNRIEIDGWQLMNSDDNTTEEEKSEVSVNVDGYGEFIIVDEVVSPKLNLNEIRYDFSRGEKVAHNISYSKTLIKDGEMINLRNHFNEEDQYRVYFDEANQDDTTPRWYLLKNDHELLINFVGTNSITSLIHDLDHDHAGSDYYAHHRSAIMNLIQKALKDHDEDQDGIVQTTQVKRIMVTGHSLAGALAQLMIYDIMAVIDDTPQFSGASADFSSITELVIATWNATGVSVDVKKNCHILANNLSHRQPQKVMIKARYGMQSGDLVQQTGASTIFSDSPFEDVQVAVLKGNIQADGFYGHVKRTAIVAAGSAPFLLAPPTILFALPVAMILGTATVAHSTVKAHTHYVDLYDDIDGTKFNTMELKTNLHDSPHVAKRLKKKSSTLQLSPVKHIQSGMFNQLNTK